MNDDVLKPGTEAPEFSLPSTPDQRVSLSEFRGRPVVLIFYPADWSPVCTDELTLYNELCGEFKKHRAAVLAISIDNVWSHLAFSKDRHLQIPLLSDFEPKGEVAKAYHAYDEAGGTCKRVLYVIDADGIIRWSEMSPIGVNPGADGALEALEKLGQEESHEARAPH